MARLVAALRRHATLVFFAAVFAVSGTALVAVGGPQPAAGAGSVSPLALFPVMVVSVAVAGLVCTAIADGRDGLRRLAGALSPRRPSPGWYLVLLIPPIAVLIVLLSLETVVSPVFAPGFFPVGLAFGLVAGLFEEIGWTGFAWPRLSDRFGPVTGSVVLGVAWAAWHLPVVDALGAASPHGAGFLAFLLAFGAALVALRVLICGVVRATGSLLLAQLLHASSTAALVTFGATRVSPGQEAFWYAAYAVVLSLPAGWLAWRLGATGRRIGLTVDGRGAARS